LSTYDLLRRCRKAFFYGDQRLANLVNFEVPSKDSSKHSAIAMGVLRR